MIRPESFFHHYDTITLNDSRQVPDADKGLPRPAIEGPFRPIERRFRSGFRRGASRMAASENAATQHGVRPTSGSGPGLALHPHTSPTLFTFGPGQPDISLARQACNRSQPSEWRRHRGTAFRFRQHRHLHWYAASRTPLVQRHSPPDRWRRSAAPRGRSQTEKTPAARSAAARMWRCRCPARTARCQGTAKGHHRLLPGQRRTIIVAASSSAVEVVIGCGGSNWTLLRNDQCAQSPL